MESNSRRNGRNEEDTLSQGSDFTEERFDVQPLSSGKLKWLSKKGVLKHFPQVETSLVLNTFSCAWDTEILRQGILYVTKDHFLFYSNIFGFVTKLSIPVVTVTHFTKEKTAKIIPNAIGIVTSAEKYVFTSFLHRGEVLAFLQNIWKAAKESQDDLLENDSSEISSFSEEDLIEEEEPMNFDENDSKVSKTEKLAKTTSPEKRKPKSRRTFRNILWSIVTVIIILLLVTSGILFYRISKIQNAFKSSKDETISRHVFRSGSKWYSKSVLPMATFMDKNINVLSNVRKSLEIVSEALQQKNGKEQREL